MAAMLFISYSGMLQNVFKQKNVDALFLSSLGKLICCTFKPMLLLQSHTLMFL